ncbi:Site-specific recombinase, DNA invertase [Thermoplasmatales archaeon BRNA1]|nr:Site-specific recombinase, DNA invertase [Thermoplasmatales archaeon BRNA1]
MDVKRVAIYVRVSTEDQARVGYSLDAQEKRLRDYCKFRGVEVADVYRDEGYSGTSPARPEYQRMFAEIDRWDAVLVLKMDRIHRNSVHFAEMIAMLNDSGKQFISVSEKYDSSTAMGRFAMDIIERIAQLESEQIGERVKIGMKRKAETADGNMGSPNPYGYTSVEGKLVVVEQEAEVVRDIFDMYISGMTMENIATSLAMSDIPTKNGGRWSKATVHKILHNPVYAGYLQWDDVLRPGNHSPIVSLNTYQEVNGPLV